MALKKIQVWKVTLTGEVTLQASGGDDAIDKAKKHFKPLDKNVTWALEEQEVWVEEAAPTL